MPRLALIGRALALALGQLVPDLMLLGLLVLRLHRIRILFFFLLRRRIRFRLFFMRFPELVHDSSFAMW